MSDDVRGRVYLVGAGPGDPGLITVRGLDLLSRADVVVNDRLASPRLLRHARPDAEVIYAGKASRDHALTQDQIIEVILDRALSGKSVVRLKGGDPFVFGRGGEEALALAEAGVDFEIVPGVSSAVAAPAYAGIPVTHRGIATSFAVITGHEAADKESSDLRWDHLAAGIDTLVFLMGVESMPGIVDQLLANGRHPDTPVALVRWGTCATQQTLTGTLADIVEKVRSSGFTAPAITVVGDVVTLRDRIAWFEKKPLLGRRIVVTRSEAQASALTRPLEELGAEVLEFPVIRFVPPGDCAPLEDAIGRLGEYDWVLFTSANGVERLLEALARHDLDVRALGQARIGAIGPRTAAALADLRLKVDYVPDRYIAEAVVEQFPEDPSGLRILVPRASEARAELPDGLRARGAEVEVVPVYDTVLDDRHAAGIKQALRDGVDIITFTSASTVNSFMQLAGDVPVAPHVIIACIGPVTAAAARAHGLTAAVVSEEFTIEGLVEALSRSESARGIGKT